MILTNKKANSIGLFESMRVTANVLCEISVYNVHFNDKIKLEFALVAVTWLEIRRLAVECKGQVIGVCSVSTFTPNRGNWHYINCLIAIWVMFWCILSHF